MNQNKNLITKNAIYLIVRLIFGALISLYTSRLVINLLGFENFGIYNVIGSFVILFSILSTAMSSATQRYLTLEIATGNNIKLNQNFLTALNIHVLIFFVIILFSYPIGKWYILYHLNIPLDKINDSLLVFYFSLATVLINILLVPFNSLLMSYEKFGIYSSLDFLRLIFNLFLIININFFGENLLVLYAFILFISNFTIQLFLLLYVTFKFEDIRFYFYWNRLLFIEFVKYTFWNLWGNISGALKSQGINIVLNIFHGANINAARGAAFQVNGSIGQFGNNLQLAFNPQIIKNFANKKYKEMHNLIYKSSKLSFLITFIFACPILVETEYILKLWLQNVPEYTSIFLQLILINLLIDSFSGALMTAAQATGKIKKYQFVVGSIIMVNLPSSYLLLKSGFEPYTVFASSILISIIALYFRLKIIAPLISLKIKTFIKKVIAKSLVLFIIPILLLFSNLFFQLNFYRFCCNTLISILLIIAFSLLFILDVSEKKLLKKYITKIKI